MKRNVSTLIGNPIWLLLSGILLVLVLAESAQAQTEAEIAKLRVEVTAINKGVPKYTKTTKDVEDVSLEGTQATYYSSAGKVRKIAAEMHGETYYATAEFYYRDGELIFVYLKRNQYDTQIGTGRIPKVVRVEEQRYYFANGDLIRLLVGKKELRPNDERHSELKGEVISISNKLKAS